MNKKETAEIIFDKLSDVDDKYIVEAGEHKIREARKKTKIYNIQRPVRNLITAAACLAIIVVGVYAVKRNNIPETGHIDMAQNNSITGNDTSQMTVDAGNPVVKVASVKEAKQMTGFGISYPDAEKPYTNVSISVYDKTMIEVTYNTKDNSDSKMYIRKGTGSDDVSGDYNSYADVITKKIAGYNVEIKGNNKKYCLAMWKSDGYSYAVGIQDHPVSLEKLTKIISQVR